MPVAARRGAARPGPGSRRASRCWSALCARAPEFRPRAGGSGARLSARRARGAGARSRCAGCSRSIRTTIAPGWPTAMCWSISSSTPMRASPSSAHALRIPNGARSRRRPRRSWPMTARQRKRSSGRSCRKTRATWPRCAASRRSRSPPTSPGMPSACCAMRCKQSAHLPLALARARAGAAGARAACTEAEAAARRLLQIEPENPQTWITHGRGGHAPAAARRRRSRPTSGRPRLKPDEEVGCACRSATCRRRSAGAAESEASYKAALAIDPAMGEAYWSLADLKNYTFSDAEIAAMQGCCGDEAADAPMTRSCTSRSARPSSSAHEYPRAFDALRAGQRAAAPRCAVRHRGVRAPQRAHPGVLRPRHSSPHTQAAATRAAPRSSSSACRAPARRSSSRSSPATRASRARWSCRTSSTSCTSSMTLRADRDGYPETLGSAPAGAAHAHSAPLPRGDRAAAHRARALHRQAAQQLQPRRPDPGDPAATRPSSTRAATRWTACFSTFKQHFAEGQTFSYDLEDLGRYYRCYLSLMDHWDAVLPGKVLHVQYEELVRDPEAPDPPPARALRAALRAGLPVLPRRPAARCAPPAPSRCASRSTPPGSAIGGISSASSSRCAPRSAMRWSASTDPRASLPGRRLVERSLTRTLRAKDDPRP